MFFGSILELPSNWEGTIPVNWEGNNLLSIEIIARIFLYQVLDNCTFKQDVSTG